MTDFFSTRSLFRDHEYADAIKERFSLSSVIGENTRVIRSGGNLMACCPFHDDRTPSLSIDDDKGLFNCFGCGAGGDVISFVMRLEGVGFDEACRRLRDGYVANVNERIIVKDDHAERASIARNIWNASSPIADTPAEAYLEKRGLPIEFVSQQENLRFARLSFDHSTKKHPALVAAARNRDGDIVAIQRIYLTENGNKIGPDCKRTLGPARGAAIRLAGLQGKLDAPDHIHVCEGLEDGLSVERINEDATVWVTMGASNLAGVKVPDGCSTVTIAADNDDAGHRAAEQAKVAFIKDGKQVRLHAPPDLFKDWNAYLMHWEFTAEVFGNDLPWRYLDEDDFYDEHNNFIGATCSPDLKAAL